MGYGEPTVEPLVYFKLRSDLRGGGARQIRIRGVSLMFTRILA